MKYQPDYTAIRGGIDYEVSQAADAAYGDEGSLYDSVVLTTKDDSLVQNLCGDALRMVAAKMSDVAAYESSSGCWSFGLPDLPAALEGEADSAIERFIVLYACTEIFKERRAALVPEYAARAQETLDAAVTLMRTRTAPARQ